MSKIEDFKKFVSIHPEFIEEVQRNNITWQKLFELYDMYGENSSYWDNINSSKNTFDLKSLFNTIKNINLDSLEQNISSIQKAVGIVEEFTKPSKEEEKVKPKEDKMDKLYGEDHEE